MTNRRREPAGTTGDQRSEFFHRWLELQSRQASNTELVAHVFRSCHAMVHAVARRIHPEDVDDIVQSVFESFTARIDEIRDPRAIPGYLRTCAIRGAQHLRHRERRLWAQHERFRRRPCGGARGDALEEVACVRELLELLTSEERRAVMLKHVGEYTNGEVAALLGRSTATARRRVASGGRKLAVGWGLDGAASRPTQCAG